MEGYSLKCMRREYWGVLRVPRICAVIFLLIGAFYGAVAVVNEQARDVGILVVLTALAICLGCLGAYFVISDEKWLLFHTNLGKSLAALGDARRLMNQIDEEARTAFYSSDHFVLLRHWLILVLPQACPTDPYRIFFRPVPKKAISHISLEAVPEEEGLFCLKVTDSTREYSVYTWESQDVDALRTWAGIQEIEQT